MKRLIFLILLIPSIALSDGLVIVSGCSTASVGVNFTEGFEGTGYENSWTEAAGTPDEDAALPAALTGGCSQGLYINAADSNVYAYHNHGSVLDIDLTALTVVINFYITTAPDDGETIQIFYCGLSTTYTTNQTMRIDLNNSGGTIQIRAAASVSSSWITIGTGAWHKITLVLATTPASSTIQYDAGTPQTFTRYSNDSQYFHLGAMGVAAGENLQVTYDLFSY